MASSATCRLSLLLLSLILGFLSITAHARSGPQFNSYKTLVISSFTVSSLKSRTDTPQNPNSPTSSNQNPSRIFTIFKEIKDFYPQQQHYHQFQIFSDFDRDSHFDFSKPQFEFPRIRRSAIPSESIGISSLRDRTKDLLSVVVALLFGVGCGALTAATMFLAWSLVMNRYDASEIEDDDDDISPEKMGYVPAPGKEMV